MWGFARSVEDILITGTESPRYEAIIRISEALSACHEPEELARILADQLGPLVHFDYLYVVILKENSNEIEWVACGRGPSSTPNLRLEDLPMGHAHRSQEPLYIADWKADERLGRLKELNSEECGNIGSLLSVPLTTPHRQLGALVIASAAANAYTPEDNGFLRMIARVVAYAIDDGLNLRRAQTAQTELKRQNDRLQLLLNLTNRITSNLELRGLLRSISGNIREVMECDAGGISLPDREPGKYRVYALDFPDGRGFVREDLVMTMTENDPAKRVFDTKKPVIAHTADPSAFAPEGRKIVEAEGLHSSCLIPLMNRGRAVGVLWISRKTEYSFTPEDVEFLSQVSGQIAIAVENALAYQEISELKDKLAQEKVYLEDEIRSEMNFDEIVGKSAALRRVLKEVETVASTESTVLIYGETGTGKELIARALHNLSPRRSAAFVRLNCAAIPTGLLESELFGHEKGAFTGAIAQRIGRFELANHGTIFLDEIGEVPLELQPKLLRVLQEREFERLGSARTLRTDARLIAATNRDLAAMVEEGKFRSDLYYRLNVFPIRVPPLRDRPEDIPLLVRHFTQLFARRMNKTVESIPSETINALSKYDWPGNIRELQNVIERAVILTPGTTLQVPLSELKPSAGPRIDGERDGVAPGNIHRVLEETERKQIIAALESSHWVIAGPNGAAARLGMKRSTLQMRMQKLGIERSTKPA